MLFGTSSVLQPDGVFQSVETELSQVAVAGKLHPMVMAACS
jgi:hypothetical protein